MFSFSLSRGAHGELTGILIIRAYHRPRNDHKRTKILVPDSLTEQTLHQRPCRLYGELKFLLTRRGGVSIEHLDKTMDDTVAGLMLTNPNTLGLFDMKTSKR